MAYIHCESKRDLYTFAHNFGKCSRIFEIFPLLNSSRNLQQNDCHTAHHTLDVLLHYLVKWQLSQTAIFVSKQCIQHQLWQTKCHTVSLWWSSSASYKDCSKCPPFPRTQPRSREHHWSIASSMTLCSRLSHTLIKRCFRSSIAATSFADLTQQFFESSFFPVFLGKFSK